MRACVFCLFVSLRGVTGPRQVEGGQRARQGEREGGVACAREPRGSLPLPGGLLLLQVGTGGTRVYRFSSPSRNFVAVVFCSVSVANLLYTLQKWLNFCYSPMCCFALR